MAKIKESSEVEMQNPESEISSVEVQSISNEELVLRLEAIRRGISLPGLSRPASVMVKQAPVVQMKKSKTPSFKGKMLGEKDMKLCPHCDTEKPVGRDFGVRVDRHGRQVWQSWCRECRATGGKAPKKSNKAQ